MPAYNSITPDIIEKLSQIVGPENLIAGPTIPAEYSYDAGTVKGPHKNPDVLVYPATTQQVSDILHLANNALIPVTPRGGGTGLAGGAVPVFGGILLDLQRMNRILHLDPAARYIVVEPAARTLDIQNVASQHGLLYAGDPCSSDDCVIAGNIATNAGGNRAVKYGVTADQIYELELVTPQGEFVTLGGRLKKNSTGYGLVRLIAGSEGTLGIITRATLKLQPLAPVIANYLVVFPDLTTAIHAVNPILGESVDLVSLELIDRETMLAIQRFQKKLLFPGQPGDCLLLQLEARDNEELQEAVRRLKKSIQALDTLYFSEVDGVPVWQGRRIWGKAISAEQPVGISEDIVVPIDAIETFVHELTALTTEFGFEFRIAGHAGDGNMHIRILPGNNSQEDWEHSIQDFRQRLYAKSYGLGGRLSGEHGIGLKRKPYFIQFIDPVELQLMRSIKQTFDPNNILNPGKIFDIPE